MPVNMPTDLASRFLERSQYYLGKEYPAKIGVAVRALPADKLWWRANSSSNSIGNLLLHLSGNVRQWIVSGIGGAPDLRERDAEFAARDGSDAEHLLRNLEAACREAVAVITSLDSASLAEFRMIQGRETSVFSAVYHVVEHFAGHTGQIILLAKMVVPDSVRFYDDTAGLARPLFLADGDSDIA
jgi:uncharacterized damage-inducible protein DinB